MNIREYIYKKLKIAGVQNDDLSAETNFILDKFLKLNNFYMLDDIANYNLDELDFIFEKRKAKIPLQYILNKADFMGKEFYVDENVLIPRPETELLVLKTLEQIKLCSLDNISVLDIGTGSGCIPVMLGLKFPALKISSADISEKAIVIAKKNAQKFNVNIDFIKSDLFENIRSKFNIIVSNPPYIPPCEAKDIQEEVKFEPYCALYTKDDLGVEYYEKIIKSARNFLFDNGVLLFELGINQSCIVKDIFLNYNYVDIEIYKDLDNIDRVICARIK